MFRLLLKHVGIPAFSSTFCVSVEEETRLFVSMHPDLDMFHGTYETIGDQVGATFLVLIDILKFETGH